MKKYNAAWCAINDKAIHRAQSDLEPLSTTNQLLINSIGHRHVNRALVKQGLSPNEVLQALDYIGYSDGQPYKRKEASL
jgi:hypothetical protein